jgi:hypothetical protein
MNPFIITSILTLLTIIPSLHADEKTVVKPYPLPDCVISEEALGSMGKPIALVYEGQEIKFCCKDCKKTFEKNPAKAMAKFDAAVKAQAAAGPK